MSIVNPTALSPLQPKQEKVAVTNHRMEHAVRVHRLQQTLDKVQSKIAPVWPLEDYVAVNPYLGFADQGFLAARRSLQSVSDFETLMSVDYYRDQFAQGKILKSDIDAAIDEMVSDGVADAETIDVNQVASLVHTAENEPSVSELEQAGAGKQRRAVRTVSEVFDGLNHSKWNLAICDEISKHCSSHYDQGQAIWPSPWQHLSLYPAWQAALKHDRSFEALGITGFREFVGCLPRHPVAALAALLERLQTPVALWEDVLLCHAMSTLGWSAWTRYKQRQSDAIGEENADFVGLLAIRLAYEVALSEHFAFQLDWESISSCRQASNDTVSASPREGLLRYALLKASEIAYRRRLLLDLSTTSTQGSATSEEVGDAMTDNPLHRPLAQMVFCIDVRSERIRRQIESSCAQIKTFGFAGFFGLPIAYVPLGETKAIDQVPVLLTPKFQVHESIAQASDEQSEQAVSKRSFIRAVRQAWKEFQSSAVSCFGFVETTGLGYGGKLVARSIGFPVRGGENKFSSRFDGVSKASRKHLGPCLHGLEEQGVTKAKQVDMAESVLRGIGLVDHFARLVVFCGHGSQVTNNPLQAGLDCGACGGHSGEANARFAAKLLNQTHVRESLVDRGIVIGDDVQFVGALHNTTTDALTFFDIDAVPESHRDELEQLVQHATTAGHATRFERLEALPGPGDADLIRRSLDWSEVRPEWGLAGNAAFIAAPRDLTKKVSLVGRSFLHSYDYSRDPEFKVLEQIMTAPMVVAHWINMQYYASTVDPEHFGSGNKTIHNVVGRFGILAGNGGDLMTGLPWQSIHDGTRFQHHPLRLMVVLAAPRDAIEGVIQKHESIRDLLTNGWIQLVAVDQGVHYRFSERGYWEQLTV